MGLVIGQRIATGRNKFSIFKDIISMASKSCCPYLAALSIGLMIVVVFNPSQTEARTVNLPSPQCHPSIISSMPPKIRKICEALSTIWEFSDAMENYLDEKEYEEDQDVLDSVLDEAKVMAERRNNSVKRKGVEDVDHVFLRFGKRG